MQLKDQEIIEPSEIHIGNIFTKLKEGEVYSNGKCYSTWFSDRMLPGSAIIDYIRNYSNSTADIDVFVSTKNRRVQDTHDIYKINLPATTSSELKNVYIKTIDDVRRSVPDHPKGRLVSLANMGIGKCITDDKVSVISKINEVVVDQNAKGRYYVNNNVADVIELVKGLKNFNYIRTGVEDLQEYLNVLFSEKEANTDLYRKMQKKYDIALKNTEIFTKIAKISSVIDNGKNKVKYKVKED